MKKVIVILLVLLTTGLNIYAQSGLKITSDLKEESSWFIVSINDEAQDAAPSDEFETDLKPGKYKLGVSFNADTIADYVKKIKIKPGQQLEYKVEYVGEFSREAGKMGRGFNRTLGDSDKKDDEGLVQVYKLVKVKKKKEKKSNK